MRATQRLRQSATVFGVPITQYFGVGYTNSITTNMMTAATGSTLVVCYWDKEGGPSNKNAAISSISDTFATPYTWTIVQSFSDVSGNGDAEIWVGTGGSGTFGKVTINAPNSSGDDRFVSIVPCTGMATVSPVDKYGKVTPANSSSNIISPSLTPSVGGDIAIYFAADENGIGTGPSAPWLVKSIRATGSLISAEASLALYTNVPTGSGLSTSWTSKTSTNSALSMGVLIEPVLSAVTHNNHWDITNASGVNTLSVSPAAVGDLMVFKVFINGSQTTTALSGGGVPSSGPGAWAKVDSVSFANGKVEMWIGTVSSSGSSTITAIFSGAIGSTLFTLSCDEFTGPYVSSLWSISSYSSTTSGPTTSVTWPTLNGAASGYSIYVGWVVGGSEVKGSTSGFSYQLDSGDAWGDTCWMPLCVNSQAYTPTATQNGGSYATIGAILLLT